MLKKVLLFIFILKLSLLSYNYDKLLLKAQTSIFPRLILLDHDISKKTYNNTIILTLVYHPSDIQKVKDIQKCIEKKYKKLDRYKLKVQIKEFKDLDESIKTSALFILKSVDEDIKKSVEIAQKKHIILFSYELDYLKKGALISLYIEDESNIYFNNKANDIYKIEFLDIFYQIVRFKSD